MAHSFLGGLVYFSIRMEIYNTQISFLQLLSSIDYPLPDLLNQEIRQWIEIFPVNVIVFLLLSFCTLSVIICLPLIFSHFNVS